MRTWLVVAALTASAPAFAESDSEFQKRLSGFTVQYVDSWNANKGGVAAFYPPDGTMIVADGQALHGGEAVNKFVEAEHVNGEHDLTGTVTEAHRIGDTGYAFGSGTLLVGDKNFKLIYNWNGVYALDGDKVAVKLLAVSIPPPPPK